VRSCRVCVRSCHLAQVCSRYMRRLLRAHARAPASHLCGGSARASRGAPPPHPSSHQLPPPLSRILALVQLSAGLSSGQISLPHDTERRWNQAVTAFQDRFSSKCLFVEYGKFDPCLSPLSTAWASAGSSRTHTYYAFVPPRLRELRDRRGALLPSPRWRARHGQPVASPFRDAGLRAPPPCIIRKRVASEAAAFSRAPLSLA
jgi:hypothetical protein